MEFTPTKNNLWNSVVGIRDSDVDQKISYEMIPKKILLTETRGKLSWSRRGGNRVLEKAHGAGKIEGRR